MSILKDLKLEDPVLVVLLELRGGFSSLRRRMHSKTGAQSCHSDLVRIGVFVVVVAWICSAKSHETLKVQYKLSVATYRYITASWKMSCP